MRVPRLTRGIGLPLWLPYPAVLGTSMALTGALLVRGVSPEVVSVTSFVFALIVVFALERLLGRSPAPSGPTMLTDSGYLVLAAAVQRVVVTSASALWLGLTVWLGSELSPVEQRSLSGRVLAGVCALLIADFAKYWLHRLAHERPSLWRFHVAHHAPTSVYSLNGIRLHPVNLGWNLLADTIAALALGLDGTTFAVVAAFRSVVAVLQHADMDLDLRGFNRVLSTPDLHHFHHSSRLTEGNTNYGSTLIVWDMLFGTRFLREGAPQAVGLAGGERHPNQILKALAWPWCSDKARASGRCG